jgi:hypothetical protein
LIEGFGFRSTLVTHVPRKIFPFALNGHPGCFRHFLNSFGLFFKCNSAEATISAPGVSGSAANEKHVDLP